jgi:hypothetical protein
MALLGLAGFGWTVSARAGVEVAIGVADEIDGRSARSYALMWLSADAHPWEIGAGFLGGRVRDESLLTSDRGYVAGGRRFRAGRFYALSGIAWVTYDDDVLSGRFQFQTGLGADMADWSVSVRHLSNGSTSGRNRGETFLLLARCW